MLSQLRGFSSYLLCGFLIVLVSWTLREEFTASNRLKASAGEEFLKIEVLATAIQEDVNRLTMAANQVARVQAQTDRLQAQIQVMASTTQAQVEAIIASNREAVSAAHDELLSVLSPENRWRVEVVERLQHIEAREQSGGKKETGRTPTVVSETGGMITGTLEQ